MLIILEKKDGSEVQSVVFDKKYYTDKEAREWLKKHNFKGLDVDEKKNVLRYRQKDPKKFKRFRMKEIKKGIKFCIGYND